VHALRPLGCRIYFCDQAAQGWQQDLSETLLARIRGLHDRFEVEYRYGEWRSMLGMFLEGGWSQNQISDAPFADGSGRT
jgi:hypothetical protein